MPDPIRPTALRRSGEFLEVDWNTGDTSRISWVKLRISCPCAACKDEREKPQDPFRVLKPYEIPKGPLALISMTPVGNYAYKFVWNDGHDTGIFPFEFLLHLCDTATQG